MCSMMDNYSPSSRNNNGGDDRLVLLSNVSLRRYEMSGRILKMIKMVKSKSRKPLSNEQADILAHRLESILYKTSPSLEAYANESSAMERVRTILTHKHAKKISQAAASFSATTKVNDSANKSFGEKRIEILQEMLGPQKMDEMRDQINQIRAIRSTSTSWAGILRAASSGGSATGDQEKKPSVVKMPKEVDAIYFHTHLIEAYAHVSSTSGPLDPGRVSMYDWLYLISEAKANVSAFRALEGRHKKAIARTPVACCIGGACTRSARTA